MAISGKEHPPELTTFQKLSTLSRDVTDAFIFRNRLFSPVGSAGTVFHILSGLPGIIFFLISLT